MIWKTRLDFLHSLGTARLKGREYLYKSLWFFVDLHQSREILPQHAQDMFDINIPDVPSSDRFKEGGMLHLSATMILKYGPDSAESDHVNSARNEKRLMETVKEHEWFNIAVKWPRRIRYDSNSCDRNEATINNADYYQDTRVVNLLLLMNTFMPYMFRDLGAGKIGI